MTPQKSSWLIIAEATVDTGNADIGIGGTGITGQGAQAGGEYVANIGGAAALTFGAGASGVGVRVGSQWLEARLKGRGLRLRDQTATRAAPVQPAYALLIVPYLMYVPSDCRQPETGQYAFAYRSWG